MTELTVRQTIDAILIVDCSASAAIKDCPLDKSRLDYLCSTLREALVDVESIKLVRFATEAEFTSIETDALAETLGAAQGQTRTTNALRLALGQRLLHWPMEKAVNLLLFTDGVPDRPVQFEFLIEAMNERTEETKLFIIQVGKDLALTVYLRALKERLLKRTEEQSFQAGLVTILHQDHFEFEPFPDAVKRLLTIC